MARIDEIRGVLRLCGRQASFYDKMMAYSTLPGKAICRIVWNMDAKKNLDYLTRALSGVPEDFAGRLLEVPVGTGVLTMPVYRDLPEADICCVDYSAEMIQTARHRADGLDIRNISFHEADVGKLPFDDESFDIVVSLNGFHAFPDKDKAYGETFRVLKPGGTFCGCFYLKGGCRRTDWFVRNLYVRLGFFTEPFETKESLQARLATMYSTASVTAVEGIGCFTCTK